VRSAGGDQRGDASVSYDIDLQRITQRRAQLIELLGETVYRERVDQLRPLVADLQGTWGLSAVEAAVKCVSEMAAEGPVDAVHGSLLIVVAILEMQNATGRRVTAGPSTEGGIRAIDQEQG
jgi:hypothetical protein